MYHEYLKRCLQSKKNGRQRQFPGDFAKFFEISEIDLIVIIFIDNKNNGIFAILCDRCKPKK